MYLDVKTRACFLIGEMIEVVGRQEIKVISMDDDVSGDKHIAEKTFELLLDKLKFLACVFDRSAPIQGEISNLLRSGSPPNGVVEPFGGSFRY